MYELNVIENIIKYNSLIVEQSILYGTKKTFFFKLKKKLLWKIKKCLLKREITHSNGRNSRKSELPKGIIFSSIYRVVILFFNDIYSSFLFFYLIT